MTRVPEHYPAPPIEEAIPPTERVLLHLIEERGESAELLFSLGNVLFRKGRNDDALKQYRRALELDPDQPRLRANIGVVLQVLGQFDDAEKTYREALMQDASLEIALFNLGILAERKGEYEVALRLLERSQRLVSTPRMAELAGRCAEALGRTEEARVFFSNAAADGSESGLAWIAADDAKRALADFKERGSEALLEAAKTLHSAYERNPDIFVRDQRVQEILRSFAEKVSLSDGASSYLAVLEILFRESIVAECFEEESELKAAEAQWSAAIESQKNYPYGNFRRGVIFAFQGNFDRALDELDLCRSKLPEKKQGMIHLRELIDAVRTLRDRGR